MGIIEDRLAAALIPFEEKDDYLRMYIIMNKDLSMSNGKLAAQAGHIAQETILLAPPHIKDEYRGSGMGTKLMMYGKLKDICKIAQQASDDGKIIGIGCDRGHIMLPYFTGEPVITGIGIILYGSESKPYIKRFSMIKD